jgi:hypothetical protein
VEKRDLSKTTKGEKKSEKGKKKRRKKKKKKTLPLLMAGLGWRKAVEARSEMEDG